MELNFNEKTILVTGAGQGKSICVLNMFNHIIVSLMFQESGMNYVRLCTRLEQRSLPCQGQ